MNRFSAIFVLLCLSVPAAASSLTVDDVLSTVNFTSMEFSPDGRWLVWSVSRPDSDANRYVSDLYRIDLNDEDAQPVRLTRGAHQDAAPQWSTDSAWIAFLSDRKPSGKDEAKTQVWRMRVDGGEPEPVTNWASAVQSFRWAGDGKILFTAEEAKTEYDRKLEKAKDDVRVVEDEDHWKPVRLFALDPDTGKVTRISQNLDRIAGFWVRRDGRAVVTRHIVSIRQTSQVGGPRPRYWLHDLDQGTHREILAEEIFDPTRVEFSADGQSLYAEWSYSRLNSESLRSSAGINSLWKIDLASGERMRIEFGDDMGLADNIRHGSWQVIDGGLVAWVARGVVSRPVRVDERGRISDLSGEGIDHWFALAASSDGRQLAGVHSTATDPHALVVGRLRGRRVGQIRVLHDPNAALRQKVTHSEVWKWKSSKDGAEVDGILHYPKHYAQADAGRRWPLMVWIHGGPAGVDADQFENYWASFPQLLAERGMFVLQPNYRGSSNHGLEYVEAITQGNYYQYEVEDILSGVDLLIDRGVVHPDSLGSTGWSNGSILTIALTVETKRFKVACAGAGDVNWTSDFGNCAFGPNFDVTYLGATPWEDPDRYVEMSPFFRLADVTTPTLIQFGEKDTSVPTEQGWQHYRALQMLDRAAVRFLVYPGMGHGLTKLSYQRRKIEEDLAWIDRHLFGRTKDPAEAVRKGSPLELLLARRPWVAGAIAGDAEGNLAPLPESGEVEGPRFARTELTRGQLESFLRSTKNPDGDAANLVGWDSDRRAFEASTRDLPATGIDADLAQAYVDWLADSTGQAWRLPTVKEWRARAAKVEPAAENNLCHWAGYTVTPDEAAAIRRRLKDYDPAELLRPVASTASEGGRMLFDLQGNAAEWALSEDGRMVAIGRTVLDSCDRAASASPAPDDRLIGLRPVLDSNNRAASSGR